MAFKPHPPANPSLIGYDPVQELPSDHLARFVDGVVDSVEAPAERSPLGQSGYHPAMLAKLLLFAYSTGVFSSRRIAQNCSEHLAYLYLSRGQRPSYHVICDARIQHKDYLERIWLSLVANAVSEGMHALGRLAVDSTRIRANASGELVIGRDDYEKLQTRLQEMLSQAGDMDAMEDQESQAVPNRTGVDASRICIRTVVRSLGKEAPQGEITKRGIQRIHECIEAVSGAKRDELKHVSLTDPDARMMPIGSRKAVSMGHALEAAVDSGVWVAGGSTNLASDSGRLVPLVDEARKHDPVQVSEVLADSGYFSAPDVIALQDAGAQVIVPDSTTAYQMRRGEEISPAPTVHFEPVEGINAYRCSEGNILYRRDKPDKTGRVTYRAHRECTGCPLATICLTDPNAKRRTLSIRMHAERITPYLREFNDPEMQHKYYARGPSVETVFAVLRRILGFTQWSVRGTEKIAAESELLKCAYQARKIQCLRLKTA
jgi:transposase